MRNLLISFFIVASVFIVACGDSSNTEYPKPRAYFRIDMPEKNYVEFDTTYPYSFRYSANSVVCPVVSENAEPYWITLYYPCFDGTLSFSYKTINDNLYDLTEDARSFANKHIVKANDIEEERIYIPQNRVYGLAYEINGTNTASPYQFYVCDSTKHFLRVALHFNHIPNNDSIAPIIDRVKEDVDTLLQSLKWKEV